MAEIIWSPEASEDLAQIAEYISRDSPSRAGRVLESIIMATERLIEFPDSGRVIPEINEKTKKEIFWKSYRIMYEIKSHKIYIAAIIHSSIDFDWDGQFPHPPELK